MIAAGRRDGEGCSVLDGRFAVTTRHEGCGAWQFRLGVTSLFPARIAMPASPDDLFAHLRDLGIETTTVSHPPLFTVADSQALRGKIEGGHTKNLFLKDKKDNFFLITADEEATVDLKSIHGVIGAASRVSFGKPEALLDLLGVTPGAVTLFGLLNDKANRVTFFIDDNLLVHDVINAHPLTNEATTSIRTEDVKRFVESTGHAFNILQTANILKTGG
jgi:Ala-tRNA(Pro) deacylase